MIDYKSIRDVVCKGLKKYLKVPVIRNNQNEEPPEYPYVSYTITTLESQNKGTYGEYEDGIDRKAIKQTWSITVQSDNNDESVMLASKAREWLDHSGTRYLNDNNIIVEQVGNITNRDNIISIEYEYKNGFDVVFWLYDETERPNKDEYIETAELQGGLI
ncbi:MAG: LIC_12616 family protein [Acutalibacteraceae bacterium]